MNDGGNIYRCNVDGRVVAGGSCCNHTPAWPAPPTPHYEPLGTLAEYLGIEPPLTMQERGALIADRFARTQEEYARHYRLAGDHSIVRTAEHAANIARLVAAEIRSLT